MDFAHKRICSFQWGYEWITCHKVEDVERVLEEKRGFNALKVREITNDEELHHVAQCLKRDGSLEGIRIQPSFNSKYMPSDSSWEALFSAISGHPRLRFLGLTKFDFSAEQEQKLGACISNSRVQALEFRFCGFSSFRAVGSALASPDSHIQHLDIGDLEGKLDMESVVKFLAGSKLRRLGLSCNVGPSANALAQLNNLEELRIKSPHEDMLQIGHPLRSRLRNMLVEGKVTRAFLESLATAIQSPECCLENLGFVGSMLGVERGELESLLTIPGNKLTSFAFIFAEEPWLEGVLDNPHCKLVELFVTRLPTSLQGFNKLQKLGVRHWEDTDEDRLADFIRSSGSNLTMLECHCSCDTNFFQAVSESQIQDLSIRVEDDNVQDVCDLLIDNPACNLRNLITFQGGDFLVQIQKKMLEALDNNLQSQLRELHVCFSFEESFVDSAWASAEFESTGKWLLKRNALFQRCGGLDKEAYIAKLFLCGPSGAGKTTISTNLCRTFEFPLPACVQRHASTSGMEMHHLSFSNTGQKLLICDLAGQFEFHAFHHSFLRGICKSIFLIVLKVDDSLERDKFMDDLVYWLRFIASHTSSSSKGRPMVFVALNFFGKVKSDKIWSTLRKATEQKLEEYHEILDSGKEILDSGTDNINIFRVQALKSNSLSTLKWTLRKGLKALLLKQQKVPGLCEDAKEMCSRLRKRSFWTRMVKGEEEIQIVEIKDIGEKILSLRHGVNDLSAHIPDDEKENLSKVIFLFLHDLGEVVYFGHRDSMATHAILNIQWFAQRVISLFIDPHKISVASKGGQDFCQQNILKIMGELEKQCGHDKVEFVLGCLYEMGVLLVMDENWSGSWEPPPTKVVVPELCSKQPHGVPFKDDCKFWGRRLQCKDVKFKLFPSGIFAMIQAQVHRDCKNHSFDVGNGWVSFMENRIQVFVLVGGDTDSWKDRQWVEIVIMTPSPVTVDNSNEMGIKAEQLVNKMKLRILEVCRGELEIDDEEQVLNPAYVKSRICHQSDKQNWKASSQEVAVTLASIHREIEDNGLKYYHTWNKQQTDKVSDLLMASELRRHIAKRTLILHEVCSDYNNYVKEVFNTSHVESLILEPPKDFKDADFDKLAKWLGGRFDRIEGKLEELNTKMEQVGKQIVAESSRMLHALQVKCPRYPYFSDAHTSKIPRYAHLRRTAKLHYFCECLEGCHKVEGVEGVELALPGDWLKKWAPVLMCSLTVLYMIVKVGTTVAGVPAVSELLETPKQGLMDFLKKNMDMEEFDVATWKQKKPSEKDIQEMFDKVCIQFGADTEGPKMRAKMHATFGLSWDASGEAWLCNEHYK